MDILIYNSALSSLLVQFIIGIFSLYGLTISLDKDKQILNEILLLETVVQIVEFSFYVWLVFNFSNIKVNYFSHPIFLIGLLLLLLCCFLLFVFLYTKLINQKY